MEPVFPNYKHAGAVGTTPGEECLARRFREMIVISQEYQKNRRVLADLYQFTLPVIPFP